MKKSVKLIACLCAAVMLLSCGITAVSAATVIPPIPTAPSYPGIFLPGTTPTPDQMNAWLQFYYPQYPGVIVSPGIPQIMVTEIELEPFEVYNIGYGTGVTYYSNNPSVAAVNPYGFIYAAAPGEASILVSTEKYTFAIIKVTVTDPAPGSIPNLEIKAHVATPKLLVGETATLHAYVTVNGSNFPWQSFGYELQYEVEDETIISFDEDTGIIEALALGISNITISLVDEPDISTVVTISVVERNTVTIPTYPGTWYPIGSGNNGIINNGWVVVIPGYGSIGGILPGYNYPWYTIPGLDSDKYDFEFRSVYVNGEWKMALVPVLKDETETEKPADPKPQEPVLTPEQMEQLAKEEAEAKRLAQLKANIALAKKGEISWYDVYSDLYADAYFAAGVNYVLNNDLLEGNDDGTFGRGTPVTYDDLATLFAKYLKITKEELLKKNILVSTDAEKPITREQLAVAFYNLAKELKLDVSKARDLTTYNDYSAVDADARVAFAWATATYIFDVTTKELNPDGTVDKAQLAQSLYRINYLLG